MRRTLQSSSKTHKPKINKATIKVVCTFLLGFIIAVGLVSFGFKFIQTDKEATIYLQRQKPVSKTLSIPSINLRVPIKAQLTDSNMKHYICQENETDYPGMPHNFVLAGHNYANNTLFSNLDQVKTGQKIIINDYYVYQIDTIKAIKAKHEFTRGNKAQITLYTCLKENNPNYRLIIQGHLVKKVNEHI